MADAAVEFLLENLKQLLLHHAHLIKDAKKQVEELENDLRLFKSFLKDTTKKRRKDDKLRELVRQIRDVVYEAEDIIDVSVTQAAEAESKKSIFNALHTPRKLLNIAEQVESVRKRINSIYGDKTRVDFANLQLEDGEPEDNEAPVVRETNVVGFEDEAEILKGYLTAESQQLDVISIIGMPGLGKTTLAGKLFRDPTILYEFPTRIWVYVSQEFTKKDIFLSILKEFTRLTDEIKNKTDLELANLVSRHLEAAKFLLVMDDVWSAGDWDKIKIALPKNNRRGKVMITSRQREVGNHVNRNRSPHMLRILTLDESWELLRWEVFGKLEFPSDLAVEGQLIAGRCGGLPLAIVVIGGILGKKFSASGDMSVMKKSWKKISDSFNTYLHDLDTEKRMEKIISLSYEKLPYYLRECFLYVGLFPEDFEIPSVKLIRMWIAEGLIQQKDSISMEETAEIYLDDLINRNLVRVDKLKPDGKVKTCRIHDMLRDFCRTEAGTDREGFFQEIKKSNEGGFQPPVTGRHKYRRLCIHSNAVDFFSEKPQCRTVRTFVCFSKDEIHIQPEHISVIPAGFNLLRVLDVKPIKFTKLPTDMYQLLHLRYITLTYNSKVLPGAFSKLWNIQTLVVETSSRVLEVKADILNMMQLRHFKTNASAVLCKTGKSSKGGEKIQTLGTISPESCTKEVFDRARNLKKLGVRGRLSLLLLDDKNASFDNFEKLENLEKLKLINDVFPSPPTDNHLRRLPPAYKFPTNLRSLTLSETSLNWRHMSIVGSLDKLEILKLKDRAFCGESWEAVDGGFRQLEVLHIGRTNLVIWLASFHHFPRLKHLKLKNCEELQQVPIGLADIATFQVLNLYRCKRAAISAKKIFEAKEKEKKQSSTASAFKLYIFPPVE